MIESVLVANRGEIARRIIRTAQRLGIRAIAVHSDTDANLPFVREADESVLLGAAAPVESYRNSERILAAARATRAQAIHPGYGFLAENAEFATAVIAAGLVWVGPSPEVIALMGDKISARNVVAGIGMPVSPGTADPVTSVQAAVAASESLGFPIMVKASAGGGGMGMAVATDEADLVAKYQQVVAFAERTFGDAGILLERFYRHARHIEVQILGLADGSVVALGERNCSVQRRNQKLAEETPSPNLDDDVRRRMHAAAVAVGEAVGYRNAGTVECLVFGETGAQDFVFLELNARLQVEHPITEQVFGVDLVEQQFRIASGAAPSVDLSDLVPSGHALELRINAEDPKKFFPGPGHITEWTEPRGPGIRVDSGYARDTIVPPTYDSLMAKLIVYGETRDAVLAKARAAVAEFAITGPKNNLAFFTELLDTPAFIAGTYDTGIVSELRSHPAKSAHPSMPT